MHFFANAYPHAYDAVNIYNDGVDDAWELSPQPPNPIPAAPPSSVAPRPLHLLVGLVTDFLDTLGIGSFATTTTAFRLGRLVDDRVVPGTLNVGHALPTILSETSDATWDAP